MSARALHYVFKIGNRKASYDFYTKVLKMKILRHEEFTEGCQAECNGPFNGKWSKTMVGYGSEDQHFVLELTYNYEISSYTQGNDFCAIIIESEEVFNTVKARGNYDVRPCGKLAIVDPDGHGVYIANGETGKPAKIIRCCVNVENLENSLKYWCGVHNMKRTKYNEINKTAHLSFGDGQCIWELRELKEGKIDRASAYGRIAFSIPAAQLTALNEKMKSSKLPILKDLVTLETPGKAAVQVIILADPDNHEVCFVGDEGFRSLSKIDPKADEKIRESITKDDSDSWFTNGKKRV
ncbi:unnamed protein product [Auanema sp. JU1783]|nr:unnamed protein product [Auanema sp. JU1783]